MTRGMPVELPKATAAIALRRKLWGGRVICAWVAGGKDEPRGGRCGSGDSGHAEMPRGEDRSVEVWTRRTRMAHQDDGVAEQHAAQTEPGAVLIATG